MGVIFGLQNLPTTSVSVSIFCIASDRKLTKSDLRLKKKVGGVFTISYNWLPMKLDSRLTYMTKSNFASLHFSAPLLQVFSSCRQSLPHGPRWLPATSSATCIPLQVQRRVVITSSQTTLKMGRGKFFHEKLGCR